MLFLLLEVPVPYLHKLAWFGTSRVSDPHPFYADPDPGFEKFADADPDPDPGWEKFAEPDPGLHFYYKSVFIDVKKSKKELFLRIKMRIQIQIRGLKKMRILIHRLQKCGSNADPKPTRV